MTGKIEYSLRQAIHEVNNGVRRHRLIIITSCHNLTDEQVKSTGVISLNLNLKLSEKLLNITNNKRSRTILSSMKEILKDYDTKQVILISHFELLFLPELQQDPIRLFEDLSRERTLVLIWPGVYKNGVLSYAQPWHSEYQEFVNIDVKII